MLKHDRVSVTTNNVMISSSFDFTKPYQRLYKQVVIAYAYIVNNVLTFGIAINEVGDSQELNIPMTKVNKIKIFEALYSQIGSEEDIDYGSVDIQKAMDEPAILVTLVGGGSDEELFEDLILLSSVENNFEEE
ncbi:MAG TPA: hypothetical protein DCW31_11780 [Lactobacillus sp.]|nr:hypothetical protein [Lactobacillus sp.]